MTDAPSSIAKRRDAEEAAGHFPPLLVEAERIAQTVAAGLHGRRRAGPGETFWQHRPYSFGDAVSAIDWRQSARAADRLYVREHEWEAAAAVYLWRDPSKSLAFTSLKSLPEKGRRADILAIALSILLSQAGERVGILGEERRPFHGRNTPARVLEALQNHSDDSSSPPAAHVPSGAHAVLISDFYTDVSAIENAARTLSGAGARGALVQVCDPAEEDFPYGGRVEFVDLESPQRLTFGDVKAVGDDYKDAFLAHRNALAALAQSVGWTFISHRTDQPAHLALLALFTAIGDMRRWMS
ncbi:MAG: DUF58 domain-containing protein [Pseudomonadota bacterium]